MSSVGQAIGGIVGGAIGFFVGGPAGALKGAQIGIMVGGVIDPPPGPVINGPRLDDLSVQTSTYGAFIPRNYGTIAQTGNVFWLKGDALTETAVSAESGGKGGPTTTTNTWEYSATFAVGLCEGPIDGVRRIWIGNQLWYDAGSDDLGTIIASNEVAGSFTLYLGTDTQQPDPLIQADKGAANVPAYRGLAYIVFDNLPLADYNNSLVGAQVKVEIVKDGSENRYFGTQTLPVSEFWQTLVASPERIVAVSENNAYSGSLLGFGEGTWVSKSAQAGLWFRVRWLNDRFVAVGAYPGPYQVMSSPDGEDWTPHATPILARYIWDAAYGNGRYVMVHKYETIVHANPTNYVYSGNDLDSLDATNLPEISYWIGVAHLDGRFLAVTLGSNGAVSDDGGISWAAVTLPVDTNRIGTHQHKGYFVVVGQNYLALSDDGETWNTKSAPPHLSSDFAVDGNRIWLIDTGVVRFTNDIGDSWTTINIPGGITLHNICLMNGMLYGTVNGGTSTVYVISPTGIVSSTVDLSSIVQAECLTSSLLTAGDLDVTELTDTVRGYRIASQGAIRGGIDPLRAAWPFDVVQHGYQIKFKRRGSASVATIDANELDAREAGADPGVQITNSRDMDTLLPRLLTLKYIDADREYDLNEQPAQRGA